MCTRSASPAVLNHSIALMPLTALIGYNPAAMPNLFKASLVLALAASVPTSLHDEFNSQQAFAYLAQVAGFGERWPRLPLYFAVPFFLYSTDPTNSGSQSSDTN